MGKIRLESYMVKVFCGIIYRDEDSFAGARQSLEKYFGPADIEAGPVSFCFTKYYEREMGKDLKRRFISFAGLLSAERCFEWKIFTNGIEESFMDRGSPGRKVNIDPGYMNTSRVVLLSTKDYSHRICLQGGIFAELTMYYMGKGFKFLPWTYPDYRTSAYLDFFMRMRQKLLTEK